MIYLGIPYLQMIRLKKSFAVIVRPPSNPNRVGKMLAPWYNDDCRAARRSYHQILRQDGKQADSTKAAFRAFRGVCKRARWDFTSKLPTLLKYHPKWFWKVILHQEKQLCPIPTSSLATHFSSIFWDDKAPPPQCPPSDPSTFVPFTEEEVAQVLNHKFNGNASSGLCTVPTPLVKFLGQKSRIALTALLNQIAIADAPPTEWKSMLLTPIYKGKGSRHECNNYRGLAVMGPLAKLFMGLLNNRLDALSEA